MGHCTQEALQNSVRVLACLLTCVDHEYLVEAKDTHPSHTQTQTNTRPTARQPACRDVVANLHCAVINHYCIMTAYDRCARPSLAGRCCLRSMRQCDAEVCMGPCRYYQP